MRTSDASSRRFAGQRSARLPPATARGWDRIEQYSSWNNHQMPNLELIANLFLVDTCHNDPPVCCTRSIFYRVHLILHESDVSERRVVSSQIVDRTPTDTRPLHDPSLRRLPSQQRATAKTSQCECSYVVYPQHHTYGASSKPVCSAQSVAYDCIIS